MDIIFSKCMKKNKDYFIKLAKNKKTGKLIKYKLLKIKTESKIYKCLSSNRYCINLEISDEHKEIYNIFDNLKTSILNFTHEKIKLKENQPKTTIDKRYIDNHIFISDNIICLNIHPHCEFLKSKKTDNKIKEDKPENIKKNDLLDITFAFVGIEFTKMNFFAKYSIHQIVRYYEEESHLDTLLECDEKKYFLECEKTFRNIKTEDKE